MLSDREVVAMLLDTEVVAVLSDTAVVVVASGRRVVTEFCGREIVVVFSDIDFADRGAEAVLCDDIIVVGVYVATYILAVLNDRGHVAMLFDRNVVAAFSEGMV